MRFQPDNRLLQVRGLISLEFTRTTIQCWALRRWSVITDRLKQVLVLIGVGWVGEAHSCFSILPSTIVLPRSTFIDSRCYARCLRLQLPQLYLAVAVFACPCWSGCTNQLFQGPGQPARAPKPFHALCPTSSLVRACVIFMLWRIWTLVKCLLGN